MLANVCGLSRCVPTNSRTAVRTAASGMPLAETELPPLRRPLLLVLLLLPTLLSALSRLLHEDGAPGTSDSVELTDMSAAATAAAVALVGAAMLYAE